MGVPGKLVLPDLVRPMLATQGEIPPPESEGGWAFEMKWDGVRAVVYVAGSTVRVMTRNDREVAATYPELQGLTGALGSQQAVLDGEIVALDAAGRPSFGELQARMHVQRPGKALLAKVPVSFLAFDVLHLVGKERLTTAYDGRRSVLEDLGLDGAHWATPPVFEGDGATAIEVSKQQGLEGVIAKRRDSTYQSGKRSRDWVKVKHVRMQEVVVGGWAPGEGNRTGRIGSLLLGVHDEAGRLVYAGHVGTGFSVKVLADLGERLGRLGRTTSPFAGGVPRAHARGAHWVTPRLVGEVVFTEWTRDGRLRHPSWRGLRPDKSPADVRREEDPAPGQP